jgi:hypothetical protein
MMKSKLSKMPRWSRGLALLAPALCCLVGFADTVENVRPIVDTESGYLLGASVGAKWLNDAATVRHLRGGESYTVYGLKGKLGIARGTKPRAEGAPCPDTRYVTLSPVNKATSLTSASIAVGGSGSGQPRIPRLASTTQATYRSVITSLLRSKGIMRPIVQIKQILRVDLEGDGQEEVIIDATRTHGWPTTVNSNSRAGEYSLVVLRKIVKGKVQNILIQGSFYPKAKVFNAPSTYTTAGVVDANGDGKMEIILRGRYYEGNWVSLHTVTGDKVKEALSSGCGA